MANTPSGVSLWKSGAEAGGAVQHVNKSANKNDPRPITEEIILSARGGKGPAAEIVFKETASAA
jgi:hypothetical protein